MHDLELWGASAAGNERNDRNVFVRTAIGFYLVDVREFIGGLKGGIELEFPFVNDCLAQSADKVVWRLVVGLDFVALPIELNAAVVIVRDVDVELKDVFVELGVPNFFYVPAKAGMGAIWGFYYVVTGCQYAIDELISIARTICRQRDLCQGNLT
ncbi:hypothetical protein D3C86_1258860 [compost metagenome]